MKSPESRPSEPKMTASAPCRFSSWPKSCALAAICQGRKTTSTSEPIFATSGREVRHLRGDGARVTVTPPAFSLDCTASASGREYAVRSSTMRTSVAFSRWRMCVAIVRGCTLSFGTTRKKFGIEPFVSDARDGRAGDERQPVGLHEDRRDREHLLAAGRADDGEDVRVRVERLRRPSRRARGSSCVSPSTSLIVPPPSAPDRVPREAELLLADERRVTGDRAQEADARALARRRSAGAAAARAAPLWRPRATRPEHAAMRPAL